MFFRRNKKNEKPIVRRYKAVSIDDARRAYAQDTARLAEKGYHPVGDVVERKKPLRIWNMASTRRHELHTTFVKQPEPTKEQQRGNTLSQLNEAADQRDRGGIDDKVHTAAARRAGIAPGPFDKRR